MSDPGSTADRGTAGRAVEDRGLVPVRTPGPPRVLRTRIQVRWTDDDVELYHRIVRAIGQSREFQGIPLDRLWQPFHGESQSLHRRHVEQMQGPATLTIHVQAVDDPATSAVVANALLRSELDLELLRRALEARRALEPLRLEFEPEVIKGRVPRSTPSPVDKEAGGGRTEIHRRISRRPRIKVERDFEDWATGDMVMAVIEERGFEDTESSQTWLEYRDKWVRAHRHIIKAVASEYDLPELLVAGVAWIEVGGKSPAVDDGAAEFRRRVPFTRSPLMTSYGHVAIQLRRAAEELGYDPATLTHLQIGEIIDSLQDPQQNLFISGMHLDRLRNIEYPGKHASELSDEDIRIIGTWYVGGPDRSLAQIKQDLTYGTRIIRRKQQILGLLEEPEAPAH